MSITYVALLLMLTGRLQQTLEGDIAGSSKISKLAQHCILEVEFHILDTPPLGHCIHEHTEREQSSALSYTILPCVDDPASWLT